MSTKAHDTLTAATSATRARHLRAIEHQLSRLKQSRSFGLWCDRGIAGGIQLFCGYGCVEGDGGMLLAWLREQPAPVDRATGEVALWEAALALDGIRVIGTRPATVGASADTDEV